MPKAVIYSRFSCNKQREASISDQLRCCEEWCARNGYDIVGTYCDYAVSGRTDERPEFQRMISNAGESDIVLVYMMDRFSRDPYDAPYYKSKLAKKKVRVVSATESIPETPEGILIEKVLEGVAAIESAHIGQRTRRGMEGNALRCLANGVRVYGYRIREDGTYEIDPEQAPVVREAFQMRLAGDTMSCIAAKLALRGVKTYRGKPCSHTMVKNMLRNEKYTGTYIWGDVRVEGGMPQIVSMEEFLMVQEVVPMKKRGNEQWDEYALSGIGYCECGNRLQGVSGRNHAGKKYTYYRCKDGCIPKMSAPKLEAEIVCKVRELLSDGDTARYIAARILEVTNMVEDTENGMEAAKSAIRDADERLNNIYRAAENGLPLEDVAERIEELKMQRIRATAELALIESEIPKEDELAEFLQFSCTLDDKTLLEAFIYAAVVGKDEITLVMNYTQTNGEPVQHVIERVRTGGVWLPVCPGLRTNVSYMAGCILLRFERVA